jgi:dihydrolipoamide dehydrogenase
MSKLIEIKVPAIGEFKNIPVIELWVKPGDIVKVEDSLITLESDKATLDVPAPVAGRIAEVKVKLGDKLSEGSLVLLLEPELAAAKTQSVLDHPSQTPTNKTPNTPPAITADVSPAVSSPCDFQTEVLVLGAGPGGYTAAFRAADLGKKVLLVERYSTLGGVCLNVGCIPSKALLHVAKVISDAAESTITGVRFSQPDIDLEQLRQWKSGVVGKLTKGLSGLAKKRNVTLLHGIGQLTSPHELEVITSEGKKTVRFEHCIIASGSSVARIPGLPYEDPRLIDSTGALALTDIPKRLLIIGGGIIGLEMATVYAALGSRITVVELMQSLIPGADQDMVKVLEKRITPRYEKILLKTKVTRIHAKKEALEVHFDCAGIASTAEFDKVLVAVGRRPNGATVGAAAAGVLVNERGFIPVDQQMRTNVAHIFAIGDVCGEPMLAHKATHEAKIAAEVICGHKAFFDARTIASVAYTDPEIAWMGKTEAQAKVEGLDYEKAVFPWAASGRAIASGREEGLTKVLIDKSSRRLIGAAMVGINAGELIAEAVLALEMGADTRDISLSIHPHPTLSETLAFATEMLEGTITDLFVPKK